MSLYLIDYENVGDAGLDGANTLSESDKVVVFYGEQIRSIPFERHVELMQSKATFEHIGTHKVAKNYLDFQLSTYLGYLIMRDNATEVCVVSNDKGFGSIVDFWQERNVKIRQQNRIKVRQVRAQRGLPDRYKQRINAAIRFDNVPVERYRIIYDVVAKSKDKLELNNSLEKLFDSAQGGLIYNHVKDIYEELQRV